METMSVAPAPAALLPEPPAGRPGAEEGAAGAKPFEQALRQELAKPESGKAEGAQPEVPNTETPKAAAAPRAKQPVPAPEWSALLEGAGLAVEAEEKAGVELAEGADRALDEDAAAEIVSGGEPAANPLHPQLAAPASVRAADSGLGHDRRSTRAAAEGATRAGAPAAPAARAANAPRIDGPGIKPDASDALGAVPGAERMVPAEAPPSTLHAPALDALASTAFAPRWAAGSAALADAAAVQTRASARIETPLGASGWGEAFQQKIVWLVDRQQQSAELHVNPPHLGPVEVTLSLTEDGTHIAFSSPHAAVREAIEASLADLKTALGEKGLSLGQATVGADPQAAREQRQAEARSAAAGTGGSVGEAAPELALPQRIVQRGLVDIFA